MSSDNAAPLSAHLNFFAAIDRLPRVETRVMASALGKHAADFLHRRWITESDYLTHVMVPFLDSEQEVEVEIDRDASVYRYRSPKHPSRTVQRPLADIAIYSLQIDTWLTDLTSMVGIDERRCSPKRSRVPGHLWHLGEVRVAGTHDFAPVFVARSWSRAPASEMTATLCDPIWPRGGIVLRHQSDSLVLPNDHATRGLSEFALLKGSKDAFDPAAFDRVLHGYVTPGGAPEPAQFLQGTRLKLPHFTESRVLSDLRAKIVKKMWGSEGRSPPVMSWADVNETVATGYQSFDDAFDSKAEREDVIETVQRGKYRLRRNP